MTPYCGQIDLNTRIVRIVRPLVWANGRMTQP